ncbi:outer membrane porin HofQ [Pseudobythopirellula maris]|uniref:Outer membrane porin HofQ n=1 Tax=Pseudobythopirellula maris TaxID=2527991 RepID=A0A5C5ZU08_9BACT|nr:general secretion pathway protein GspD [Pseudobythopirellula maris]TWT90686.1 outer membrane porin HofQ [Pseudobythopirellula maris]
MNATRKFMTCGALLFAAASWGFEGAAQAQSNAPTASLDRQAVDSLLSQARLAMSDGDFARADKLISQTERSGVSYPLLHMGDKPSKARRDLEFAKQNAPAGSQDPFRDANSLAREGAIAAPAKPAAAPLNGYAASDGYTTKNAGDRYGVAPMPLPPSTGASPLGVAKQPSSGGGSNATPTPKAAVQELIAEARRAMERGDFQAAEILAGEASTRNVPESSFGEQEDSPARLAWDLQRQRYQVDAGAVTAAGGSVPMGAGASQAIYSAENGASNVTLTAGQATRLPSPMLGAPSLDSPRLAAAPQNLLQQGEQALRDRNMNRAREYFVAAQSQRDELDPQSQQRLDDHLRMLSPSGLEQVPGVPSSSLIDTADQRQQVLSRQLSTAVGQAQVDAREIRESEPRRSLEMLQAARKEVMESELSAEHRDLLVRRIDRSLEETKTYIENNRSEIELDEQNAAVLAEIDRERSAKAKVREKIAELVNEFNVLLDEQRYEEAEVVAKRLFDLAPTEPIAQQVWQNAKFIRREIMNQDLRDRRDTGNWNAFNDVEESAIPNVFDNREMVFNAKTWGDVENRSSFSEQNERRSPRELEIQQRLKTEVQPRYTERPLSEVMQSLSQMAGVNIHLDPRGLSQEGISTDTPVSLNLNTPVTLKSALNLLLTPLHLGYTIKDEVLKITSETLRDGDVKTQTYYVADLVVPIPNFVPSNNIGLQGLINDALAVTGYGAGGVGAPGPIALANNRQGGAPGAGGGVGGQDVLAQNFSGGGFGGGGQSTPVSTGPGGLGGAAAADFDSLIDLIVSTVATDTWAENGGGEAEIRPFPTNLSLVVSQTQAVHEEIADLLRQLRRLQDLQVTIEVRFIRLSDSFFERIGIDFDLNINDGTSNPDLTPGAQFETPRASATVGLEAPVLNDFPRFTADLDIPFRQGNFNVALPQFGGFDPTQAATFGFAILSDIEAYFLINAAQGDSRTNVLNAPKVTLFNGQQAFVSDTSQSPFVISVIPVVGEFAAAQQPVIVVLSEGTLMSIQAVVSDDRRYVRLTVVPFFSEIGDVDTFTFEGSSSTSASSASTEVDQDGDGENENATNNASNDTVIAGTTVQLPTFQFVSVTTTVSVPDGGTVLLGGIKRLSEGRREFGVPLLSKVPYINRLFKNVGIGRETDSLMMMVTPRIIIQEEEEERLGIAGN